MGVTAVPGTKVTELTGANQCNAISVGMELVYKYRFSKLEEGEEAKAGGGDEGTGSVYNCCVCPASVAATHVMIIDPTRNGIHH